MADKIPVKAIYSGSDVTSLGELASGDTINASYINGLAGEVTGTGGATVIADNVVDEANLKVSNSPTNGYALTAQSGNTGGLTWASAGGGGGAGNILQAVNIVNNIQSYHAQSYNQIVCNGLLKKTVTLLGNNSKLYIAARWSGDSQYLSAQVFKIAVDGAGVNEGADWYGQTGYAGAWDGGGTYLPGIQMNTLYQSTKSIGQTHEVSVMSATNGWDLWNNRQVGAPSIDNESGSSEIIIMEIS